MPSASRSQNVVSYFGSIERSGHNRRAFRRRDESRRDENGGDLNLERNFGSKPISKHGDMPHAQSLLSDRVQKTDAGVLPPPASQNGDLGKN